ncbi:hypothetical protein KFE96_00100 [Kordiimonas sp. SCSIO 12603]|uniref:hypothetical protein n=1 Tax=Kordiimonas sp. SCSIO 12603 TaxID=2829596 RepID=UPI002107123D|nr:hypothetical protein [Kordiimonas sp. SCSIO 12603]UTW58743.1 hypothetical protein KFE96_00100 [Kordiimonas sp. SCSIO 12603]
MNPYHQIEVLQDVYLEDSFVRSIVYDRNAIVFQLDLVLLECHAQYSAPKPSEEYCYRLADLRFERLARVVWNKIYMKASIDADNEIDFGNIDSFQSHQGAFFLSGDWGELEVQCSDLELIIHPL